MAKVFFEVNVRMAANEGWANEYTITENGVAKDLTTSVITLGVKKCNGPGSYGQASVFTCTKPDAANGIFSPGLTAAQVGALGVGTFKHDLLIRDTPSSEPYRFWRGTIEIDEGVQ